MGIVPGMGVLATWLRGSLVSRPQAAGPELAIALRPAHLGCSFEGFGTVLLRKGAGAAGAAVLASR